jgi:PAS domain S-box-containing protein
MDMEVNSAAHKTRDLEYRLSGFSRRVPLTFKIVLLTIFVGIVVWVSADIFLNDQFRNIFHARLIEDLSEHALEDRQSLDRYLMSFQELPRLIVKQKDFIDYMKKRTWSERDIIHIKRYDQFPYWLPKRSTLRVLSYPRTILLLDRLGKTREIFQWRDKPIPQSLLAPSKLVLAKSHNQAFMTLLDGTPYVVTSELSYGPRGELKAVLLLASPLDSEFLLDVLTPLQHRYLVALAGPEKHARIFASSDPDILPAGTDIDFLQEHYLITRKEFFDYGASEIQVKFFSFAPREEINSLTQAVISKERRERAVLAISLILASALVMYVISKRLQHISGQIADFSKQVLGVKTWEIPKGDQIHILKERFRRLAAEVIEARKIIKNQAEEKTRLIVDNAYDAIITTDIHGIIESWNPQSAKMFGWSCEETVGKVIYDVIVPEQHYDLFSGYLGRCTKTGKCAALSDQIEISVLNNKNREFPAELTVSSALCGRSCIFIFIIRDITDRKEAEGKILFYQEQLRALMSKLAVVEEQERKRLSEGLHDNISQNLAMSKMQLEEMLETSPDIAKEINETRELIEQTIKFIRSLTFDMSPPVLYELGFAAAVEWLTEKFHEKYDLQITYISERTFTEPAGEISVLLFRTIRELLMNVVKHSRVRQAKLIISGDGNIIEINVEDNGAGFDTSDLSAFLIRKESFGILSIRERIRYLKGTFEISSRPDRGTKVKIAVPLQ